MAGLICCAALSKACATGWRSGGTPPTGPASQASGGLLPIIGFHSRRKSFPYFLDCLACRRHHANDHERPTVNYRFAVDEKFVLAVTALDHLHVYAQLTTNPRRHTGGMQAGDSKRAIPDRHSRHCDLPGVVAGFRHMNTSVGSNLHTFRLGADVADIPWHRRYCTYLRMSYT